MISLAKALEPSMRAASATGPKHGIPAAASASATPATSGASGPTTTRSTCSRRASATTASGESAWSGTLVPTRAVPGLPGPTSSFVNRGLWDSFHASACSRAPEPRRRTFTSTSFVERVQEAPGGQVRRVEPQEPDQPRADVLAAGGGLQLGQPHLGRVELG